jgi:TonB family protein
MRRLLSAAVLLPALALAQASTSAAQAPLTQQAKATPVAYPFSPAKTAAPAPKVSIAPHVTFHDVVSEHLNSNIEDYSDSQTATIGFRIGDDSSATAPKLVHMVTREIPASFTPDGGSKVSVRMVVNKLGVPTAVTVVHSGGSLLDERTLEAVNQYRFQPAYLNNLPVEADLTLDISLVRK